MLLQLTGLDLGSRKENETLLAVNAHGSCSNKHLECQNPFKELFIWAVLNNMQKMALCFWKRGEEAMATALVACKLYSAMAKYAEKGESKDDIIDTLRQNGEYVFNCYENKTFLMYAKDLDDVRCP